MKLVYLESNRPVTDSLTVAETFGKDHDKVLRDIRDLECSKEFSLANFGESTYTNERGREYPMYFITQDGFSFLVMGYTGTTAAQFKEKYINEFNRMRDEINNKPQFALPQNYVEALEALVGAEKDKLQLQEQNAFKDQQLALQAPKAALYDTAMSAKNNITMMQVAKTLGVGRNKLFDFLRGNRILMKNNLPYQTYVERGYFDVRQYTITHFTTGLENKTQTLVTPKGMAWIYELLRDKEVTA